MSYQKTEPRYRAVLRLATNDNLEMWELQQKKPFLIYGTMWEPMRVVATKEDAQHEINRLESEGTIYPETDAVYPEVP